MLFSDYYRIKRTKKDDWFDPILDHGDSASKREIAASRSRSPGVALG